MNRMNVNFFICEKSLFFFLHFVLFGGFLFCFVFYLVCLVRERWPPGVPGSPRSEGLGLSLSSSLCVLHPFPFKIGILHVEPALENSEN